MTLLSAYILDATPEALHNKLTARLLLARSDDATAVLALPAAYRKRARKWRRE